MESDKLDKPCAKLHDLCFYKVQILKFEFEFDHILSLTPQQYNVWPSDIVQSQNGLSAQAGWDSG